jgi:hypothetical protein
MFPRSLRHVYSLTKLFVCALAAVVAASAAHAFDVKRYDASVLRVFMFEVKPDGKRENSYWMGTGFVIDREYVLTNHHVIDDGDMKKKGNRPFYTVVDGSMSNQRQGTVVWSSSELDLALLRVPGLTRPALTLSSGSMMDYPGKAEIIWSIGFPGIVSSALKSDEGMHVLSTVTKGVVAKTVMGSMVGGQDKRRPVVQHNASSHKGNSGGPMLDDCGVVVAVHTFAPYAVFDVVQYEGKQVAHGVHNTGVFFAPHIGNFLAAHRESPALKAVNITTSSAACPTAMGETGGLPVWLYGAIGLLTLLAVTGLFVGFTRRREVVRMVESYSAYVKRKGRTPSEESMMPRPVSSPPDISSVPASRKRPASPAAPAAAPAAPASAPSGWKLAGKGSQGQPIALSFTAQAVLEATGNKEGGLILGRSKSLADTIIEDPTISRRHAKIYATEQQGLAIEDLKSAHGTKVNGQKLEPFQAVEIKAGDKIRLGGVEFALARGR